MTIQVNSDHNLTIHDEFRTSIHTRLSEGLHRFSSHLTRLEVHFSDENGGKEGINDKKCVLEARLSGQPVVTVKDHGNTYDQALAGCIAKIKSALGHKMDKLKEH